MDFQYNNMRYGFRTLLKLPGWTTVMCTTLALGIALTTVVFSVAYSLLIRPLPYSEPDRLVTFWTNSSAPHLKSVGLFYVGAANWQDWRDQSKSFEDISLTRLSTNFSLTGDGPPEPVQGARTWWNLPQVLGVRPILGHMFTEQDCRANAKVVVLSYGFWKRRFGGDLGIVGRKIQLNEAAFEVIGIMPRDFWYPTKETELWTPLLVPNDELTSRWGFFYRSAGRLKPGVSVQQAQQEMSGIMQRLAQEHYASNGFPQLGVLVEPVADSNIRQFRKSLNVLLATVGCLMLIVCINLGTLMIVRANARRQEFAVRAALGAAAGQLRSQMFAEVVPLSAVGGLGGLLLAWLLLRFLVSWLPPELLGVSSIDLDVRVLGSTFLLAVLVVLIAAMLPARVASRASFSGTMRLGSRTVSGGAVRGALVAAQIAVTLVLVFAGGLLVRSLIAAMNVDPGFSTEDVLTMQFAVSRTKFAKDSQVADYYQQLIARVKTIPGVTEAAMVHLLPLSGLREVRPIKIEGMPDEFLVDVDSRAVAPRYFATMRIPLLRGRDFTDQDKQTTTLVAIIDENLAGKVFGNTDPLGKRFKAAVGVAAGGTAYSPWIEVVGVVGHIRNENLESDPRPQMYWPETQQPQDRNSLVVRTSGSPGSFTSAVIEQIRNENPDQTVYNVQSMKDWRDRTLRSRYLLTSLVTLFGGSALLLACLGLYGVVSYGTGLRSREFAVRMAIGAQSGDVRRLVLKYAIRIWIIGCVIGLITAWPSSRLLQSVLFGVRSTDAVALMLSPFLLLVAALLAGYGPARKAGRVDPSVTLRGE